MMSSTLNYSTKVVNKGTQLSIYLGYGVYDNKASSKHSNKVTLKELFQVKDIQQKERKLQKDTIGRFFM